MNWGKRKVRVAIKGHSSFGDGTVLYLDCINVNNLVVMVYYSFERCYHWGENGKRHMNCSLHYFLQVHVNLLSISKF